LQARRIAISGPVCPAEMGKEAFLQKKCISPAPELCIHRRIIWRSCEADLDVGRNVLARSPCKRATDFWRRDKRTVPVRNLDPRVCMVPLDSFTRFSNEKLRSKYERRIEPTKTPDRVYLTLVAIHLQ